MNRTLTRAECEGAARPDVDPELQNNCVQCLPDHIEEGLATTYTIPLEPVASDREPDTRRGGAGLALHGVKLEGPALVEAILSAYTIAPFNDFGGHINQAERYHYHAVTERQEEAGLAPDESWAADIFPAMDAALIDILLDGYPVLVHAEAATDTLDICGGYEVDGSYRYHTGATGSNRILGFFAAQQGCSSHDADADCDASQRPPRP